MRNNVFKLLLLGFTAAIAFSSAQAFGQDRRGWPYTGSPHGRVSTVKPQLFLAAGDIGDIEGDGIEPGDTFPPGPGSYARLSTSTKCLSFRTRTTGLPPGAYTVWWIVFNNPENCTNPGVGPPGVANSDCGMPDLFNNPEANTAVFWATGGIVSHTGIGQFSDRICLGDDLGFPDLGIEGGLSHAADFDHLSGDVLEGAHIGGQHLWGEFANPTGALVWLVYKYHGRASSDPLVRYYQTHTIQGSCYEGANAFLGEQGDAVCFDPQISVFNP